MKNSQQRDKDVAIMDAKLKAIERAGVEIILIAKVENFQLKRIGRRAGQKPIFYRDFKSWKWVTRIIT